MFLAWNPVNLFTACLGIWTTRTVANARSFCTSWNSSQRMNWQHAISLGHSCAASHWISRRPFSDVSRKKPLQYWKENNCYYFNQMNYFGLQHKLSCKKQNIAKAFAIWMIKKRTASKRQSLSGHNMQCIKVINLWIEILQSFMNWTFKKKSCTYISCYF